MTKYRVTDDTTFTAAVVANSPEEAKQLCVEEYSSHKQDIQTVVENIFAEERVRFGFESPNDTTVENLTEPTVVDLKYL